MFGKLVVIDGPDGVGKATVVKNVLALWQEHRPFGEPEVIAQTFPNYPEFYGRRIRNYLDGDSAPELVRVPENIRLDPYCASADYAADRYITYRDVMKPALERGATIICDRYYTSNMGHQGGRMAAVQEKLEFFDRLMWLETGFYRLPQPDAVVILELPEEVRANRTERRRQQQIAAGNTGGQVGSTDIHEQSPEHMRRAADTYRLIAQHYNWPINNGYQNGRELTESEQAQQVYELILQTLRAS